MCSRSNPPKTPLGAGTAALPVIDILIQTPLRGTLGWLLAISLCRTAIQSAPPSRMKSNSDGKASIREPVCESNGDLSVRHLEYFSCLRASAINVESVGVRVEVGGCKLRGDTPHWVHAVCQWIKLNRAAGRWLLCSLPRGTCVTINNHFRAAAINDFIINKGGKNPLGQTKVLFIQKHQSNRLHSALWSLWASFSSSSSH